MLYQAVFLLLLHSTFQYAHSQDTHNPDEPVDLLTLKHIVISNYHGPLHIETMRLFGNVETLHLKNSNFTPLAHDYLQPLKNLERVYLYDSVMQEVDKDITTCCKKIKDVQISNTGIEKIPYAKLSLWPLEKLVLIGEKIPTLDNTDLKNMKLKTLKISKCHLETIGEGTFDKAEDLEDLDLSWNDLKTISKETLAPLKNLKRLNLANNKLEKITTDMFPSLPNLVHLNVGDNPLKEFNLDGIKSLAPKLSVIEVSGIDIDTSKSGGVALIK